MLLAILSPSVRRVIFLPITKAHRRRPRPYRPRHPIVPIQPCSRTSIQRINELRFTSITADREVTAVIDQLDSQVGFDP